MKIYLPIILIFSSYSLPTIAQVYQWVDEDGLTHFSESPRGTPDEAYPVKRGAKQPEHNQAASAPPAKEQKETNSEKVLIPDSMEGWPECYSGLCEKVKKIDAECATQDCTEAVKFSNDCKTILCMGDRIDFEKKIDAVLQQIEYKDKASKEPEAQPKEEKQQLSDKEVLEKCKKERNVKCRKNIDYYRVIYNGNKEERKKAWHDMRNARTALRKDPKDKK